MEREAPRPDPDRTDQAFDDQRFSDEVVEIDEHGNVFRPHEAPGEPERKPTVLWDPEGEYAGAD